MDSGFVKADSTNLPLVDFTMVSQYYIDNIHHFSAEMKNLKTQKSSKESYGDNAISYVQLKREGSLCTVRGKITPEHKIHKKAYNVEVIVNEEEENVLSSKCNDCAAASGSCKHSVAFLFWLHRRSEEPSSTSVECYWKASKLSRVGSSGNFLSIKDIAGARPFLPPKDESVFQNFIKMVNNDAKGVVFQLYNDSILDKFDIYQLILKYRSEKRKLNTPESFLKFAGETMGNDLSIVEEETRNQYKSSLWYSMRFGRVTASKVYEAARCKSKEGSLFETIMGAAKPFDSLAIKRGRDLEDLVLEEVKKIKNINIKKVGLLLSNEYPVMGASPDSISEEHCIEVKCPSKEKTYKNYIRDGVICKKYYCQIQMQMLFAKKQKGYFCVASPNFEEDHMVTIQEVFLNKEEILDVMNNAMAYWKENVFKHLIKI